ncbi:MAG: hypothetical protein L0Z51_10720 [Candidatus Latescibacteria bacterium]|nr:hypothetical protein [Candidatus Latescibacterota bacterium]
MNRLDRRIRILALAVLCHWAAASMADPPASAPPATTDQPNVRRVEKFAHVAAFLNLAQGTVRIVAVVPVDGSSSAATLDTVAAVVRGNPSKRLRAYVVLHGLDSSLRAASLAGRAADPRIVVFWDPSGAAAAPWQSDSSRAGVWLYDTSARFAAELPEPSLVVGAPADTSDAPIDGAALRNRSGELVRRVEAKMVRADDGS